jgi:hypothetical protein
MRRNATVVGLVLLTASGLSGCASAHHHLSGQPTAASRSISRSTSTTTPARSSSECASFNPGPPFAQPSLRLAPLLLTDADAAAAGFAGSSPSGIVGPLGDFNSAAPRTIPFDGVSFYDTGNPSSYHEPVYFGQGLEEMLAEETSAQSADALAAKLATVNVRCNPGTALVALPGTEPSVNTRVSTGATYSSAIAYATKGPYVVQLTWATSSGPPGTPMPTLAPLPTAADMASVTNAALAHLP